MTRVPDDGVELSLELLVSVKRDRDMFRRKLIPVNRFPVGHPTDRLLHQAPTVIIERRAQAQDRHCLLLAG